MFTATITKVDKILDYLAMLFLKYVAMPCLALNFTWAAWLRHSTKLKLTRHKEF